MTLAPCDCLKELAFELGGVIIDWEFGVGPDSVCLETVKRVRSALLDIAHRNEVESQKL